jgi:hypothetical protein
MTPAGSLLQPDSNPALYVSSVLTLYVDLPDTPLRASASDQSLARRLYDEGVSLQMVETALMLGSLRRLIRPQMHPNSPRSAPWPTSDRSSTNSTPILRRKGISITSASSCAKPPRLSRRTSKNLRFLMTANISTGLLWKFKTA